MRCTRPIVSLETRIDRTEQDRRNVSTLPPGQSPMNDKAVQNRSLHVLVLAKNSATSEQITSAFDAEKISHEIATVASHGLKLAAAGYFDAVVVDTDFTAIDGEAWVSALRNMESATPCLLLLGREDIDNDWAGITNNADDFLLKPFAVSELYARLHMLARRPRVPSPPTVLRFADMEMNLVSRQVTRAGRQIHLPPRQFQVLELLMKSRGRVVSQRAILDRFSDATSEMGTSVVQANVCRLRAQIDRVHEASLIRTVRGRGYSLQG